MTLPNNAKRLYLIEKTANRLRALDLRPVAGRQMHDGREAGDEQRQLT